MKQECGAYIDAEASMRFSFRNNPQMLKESYGANLEKIKADRFVATCLMFNN